MLISKALSPSHHIRNYSAIFAEKYVEGVKSHDKNMAVLCAYCVESKIEFYRLMSKKCTLYEIESINKFLVNSNFDLKKYLYVEYLPANDLT